MKNKINKIFQGTDNRKFARELMPIQSGLFLIRGEIKLDDTHRSLSNEVFPVLLTAEKDELIHSLVICSQGAFFDDVKVWSGEDIKSLQAAIVTLQNTKQNVTEQALATQARSVAGAINELFEGGVKDKSIGASKLAQAVQDTLGMVGTNVKEVKNGEDLFSLEDGIYTLNGTTYINYPIGIPFNASSACVLVVTHSNQRVTIYGVDGSHSSPILPLVAIGDLENKSWTGGSFYGFFASNYEVGHKLDKKLDDTAGAVKTANLANGAVTTQKLAEGAVLSIHIADMAVKEEKLGLELADKINGAAQKSVVSKALEVIELTDNNTQNKAALDARIAKLTELGVDLTNGYAIPISYISGNKEYHGMVTAGKNSLLNGIVSDAQGQSYFGISVGATDGIVTFEEADPLVFKSEMSSAIDTLVECVEFTKTTLSNKAQLDAYLAKLPNAKVMCCTYNGGYAGTLHKINGSWYGVLVSESNTLAGQLSIKLQADGTIVEGTA